MSQTSKTPARVTDLHEPHPRIRAKDWRSPLVKRLLKKARYQDGECDLADSFRKVGAQKSKDGIFLLSWSGLDGDFDQTVKTYQEPVITEFATLGLACILVARRAGLEITEVTRRGDRADYWLGDREYLLEVSGQQEGNLEDLCSSKAGQLLDNPFGKAGYVCVATYDAPAARLWFYAQPEQEKRT